MCNNSVAPMPSITRSPSRSRNLCQVSRGMCSPADTAVRSPASFASRPSRRITLYAVGAVASTVTPCRSTRSATCAGVAASVSRAHAPARNGNTTSMPRPNVNANGAVHATRSSSFSRRT